MKRIRAKQLLLFVMACAVWHMLPARTWEVKAWSYSRGSGVSRQETLSYAVQRASNGDVIELQNDVNVLTDLQITKEITICSKSGETYSIKNQASTRVTNIHPGGTLTMSNVVYDCEDMSQITDVFLLMPMEIENATTNISRLILDDGAVIQNAYLTSNSDSENAVIHVKTGAVVRINSGAAILNCRNESSPGKGGAICCDFGTVIMTGGTIAGCTAKGAGGAIHTDGTRVDNADHYGISSRGDIYISGGYITNNTCGAGLFGGGIYLGNSGPVLHITGTAVISNNFSGTGSDAVPDDVSTYLLENAYANRLKLVDYHESQPDGFTYAGELFTGWVGVRYPRTEEMTDPQYTRFGAVWEYFAGHADEARQFFWNGNNAYRGRIDGNALVWSSHVVHELPKDGLKVAELIATGESPIYCELSTNYIMSQTAWLPAGCQIIIDLQGYDLECDFHVTNETSQVVIRDSSSMKSGTVTGHRESDFTDAFVLEGGSYHTLPKPEWVASNRVVIGNYCTNHPYMVAIKVWDAEHERVVTDLTAVPLEQAGTEVRNVEFTNGIPAIGQITFSTGDWKFMQYTNSNLRVQVQAVAAVSSGVADFVETGARVTLFDSSFRTGTSSFGQEDEFEWSAAVNSHGLVKLIHITMSNKGEIWETNDTQVAYFRFPEAAFEATQRKTRNGLPITVVDSLLASLGYNRAEGFAEDDVNDALDTTQQNGLMRWENIVTGTSEDQLLLSAAEEVEGGLALNIALSDAGKSGRTDTGYHVRYDLRKYGNGVWTSVGEIKERPDFSIPLLDGENKSVGASGFYRVTTLIVPDGELSVTNEIPSTNIVGVLEVASSLTNTLTAVPWVALAEDPAHADSRPVTVSNYVHTSHLDHDDSVQVADKGHIYRKWSWNKSGRKWEGAITVTRSAVEAAPEADVQTLPRNSAVWITREDPAEKPFFLIGQYSSVPVTLAIESGTADSPVCTLVPNPSLEAVKVNDYGWGGNPVSGDIIRIPNEKAAPLVLTWNAAKGEWGRYVNEGRNSVWKNDAAIPAGTGFWYLRCGAEFEIALPNTVLAAE